MSASSLALSLGAPAAAQTRVLLAAPTAEAPAISRVIGPNFNLPRTVISGIADRAVAAELLATEVGKAVPAFQMGSKAALTAVMAPLLTLGNADSILLHTIPNMYRISREVALSSSDQSAALQDFWKYFDLPGNPPEDILLDKGSFDAYFALVEERKLRQAHLSVANAFAAADTRAISLLINTLSNLGARETTLNQMRINLDNLVWVLGFYKPEIITPILEAVSRRVQWRTKDSSQPSPTPRKFKTAIALTPFTITDAEDPSALTAYPLDIESEVAVAALGIITAAVQRAQTMLSGKT